VFVHGTPIKLTRGKLDGHVQSDAGRFGVVFSIAAILPDMGGQQQLAADRTHDFVWLISVIRTHESLNWNMNKLAFSFGLGRMPLWSLKTEYRGFSIWDGGIQNMVNQRAGSAILY
jgi:hypothetical protein